MYSPFLLESLKIFHQPGWVFQLHYIVPVCCNVAATLTPVFTEIMHVQG